MKKITFEKNDLGDQLGCEKLNSWRVFVDDALFGMMKDLDGDNAKTVVDALKIQKAEKDFIKKEKECISAGDYAYLVFLDKVTNKYEYIKVIIEAISECVNTEGFNSGAKVFFLCYMIEAFDGLSKTAYEKDIFKYYKDARKECEKRNAELKEKKEKTKTKYIVIWKGNSYGTHLEAIYDSLEEAKAHKKTEEDDMSRCYISKIEVIDDE